MCLMRNTFHFPQYLPDMTDGLKRREWIQQGEIEILRSAKRRKKKKRNLTLLSVFISTQTHFLSDQEIQESLKKGAFTMKWRRHGRKFVSRYFALALFCGTYQQAWLLDLEFMLGSKISFPVMHASHQTRSHLILQVTDFAEFLPFSLLSKVAT